MGARKVIKQIDKFIENKKIIGNVEIKINPEAFTAAIEQMEKVKKATDDFCAAIAYAYMDQESKKRVDNNDDR